MREFTFYLDAWKFCVDNMIEADRIHRKDWKTWAVNEDE